MQRLWNGGLSQAALGNPLRGFDHLSREKYPLLGVLSLGLLVSLLVLGCGGSGGHVPLQPGEEWNGPPVVKEDTHIPAPGTVLTQNPTDWAFSFLELSRGVDTNLVPGWYSNLAGAPTSSTVPLQRVNLFSAAIPDTARIVWTLTPNTGVDADLVICHRKWIVGNSSKSGDVEDWVAFAPETTYRVYALVYGWAGAATIGFKIEADLCWSISPGGWSSGKEYAQLSGVDRRGSDWFLLILPSTGSAYTATVNLTAVGGTDPDLYLYDPNEGNGSAPFASEDDPGSDSYSFTTWGGFYYARVKAWTGSPCKYVISLSTS
jgi:hypothetical protein